MKFYKDLSNVYDIVFPWNKVTHDFLKQDLEDGAKVLDLACGSGNYSIALSKEGFNVTALDLDFEMIKLCKAKASKDELNINFIEGDMLKLPLLSAENFDRIFCIGNSLVHITNKDDIEKVIKDTYYKLSQNATLIIQIINYDRILKFKIDSLPPVEKDNIKFYRNYSMDYLNNIINFNTEIIINNGEETETYLNSVPLIPLLSTELIEILNRCGFSKVKTFSSFNGEPFDINSYALIVKAYK